MAQSKIGVIHESQTSYYILYALSLSHLLNDTLQSLIPSIYPIVKSSYNLSFTQIGLVTLTFQLTASLFQPLVGLFTDKRPQPFSLVYGMSITFLGLIFLSFAHHFYSLLLSVALIGTGSSIFHPEASRMAHAAAGKRRGFAQSVFQVGGNAGSSFGPLLAAWIVVPNGQKSIIWFTILALMAIVTMHFVGQWYQQNVLSSRIARQNASLQSNHGLPRNTVIRAVVILLFLIFSKYFYMASLTSYFTFYLMEKFSVSVQLSQIYLFIFLFSVAAGTFFGGPLGDRIGRKYVIWISILGAAPFALLLPHANLFWTTILIILIGFILASAFSAILVYAQELIPGKVGLVSGLFFGFAFGMGGLGSALIGKLIDQTSIEYVYSLTAFLPLMGLITAFLPNIHKHLAKA